MKIDILNAGNKFDLFSFVNRRKLHLSSYMYAYSPDFNFYDPKSCVIDLLAHGHKTNG